MGLRSLLTPRRPEPPPAAVQALPLPGAKADPVFSTKALRKVIKTLASRPSPVLLDLGPVVGHNVSFFGEQLGCKIFVEDVFADLDRHVRERRMGDFPSFLKARFSRVGATVDAILCWDLIDYLDKASSQALAAELTRVLGADGVLLGFFATAPSHDARYTKYVVVDEVTLKYRPYPAARGRQLVLQNRDIMQLFGALRVSDSFLLQNKVREILFRKPAYLAR
jgi:hypothetical protein